MGREMRGLCKHRRECTIQACLLKICGLQKGMSQSVDWTFRKVHPTLMVNKNYPQLCSSVELVDAPYLPVGSPQPLHHLQHTEDIFHHSRLFSSNDASPSCPSIMFPPASIVVNGSPLINPSGSGF